MAFGGLRGTLTGLGTSIVTPETATGSVAVSLQDLIVVFVAEAAANTVTTVTDNLGGTYTAINAGTLSSVGFRGYYRYVAGGTAGTLTTVSCVMTSSSNDHAISVAVYEGPFTSTPLDRAPANTTDAATPYTCAATTVLSQANELIVAGLGLIRCQTATATSPNTLAINTLSAAANTNNAVSSTIGSQVVAATTSVTPAFASSGTITGGVQIVATFRQGVIDTTRGTIAATAAVTGYSPYSFGYLKGTLSSSGASIAASNAVTGTPISLDVGDLIILVNHEAGATSTVTAVTDNLGNTYTQQVTRFWYHRVVTPGTLTTVTTTATASSNDFVNSVSVFAGPFVATGIIDANPGGGNDTTSPFDLPATGTLSQSKELVVGLLVLQRAQSDVVATAPFTLAANIASAADDTLSSCCLGVSYLATNSTASVAPQFTITAGTINAGIMATFSFKGLAFGDGAGAATGTASSVGRGDVTGYGSVAAVGTVDGRGSSDIARSGTGSAVGSHDAVGLGTTDVSGVGSAASVATASAVGDSTSGTHSLAAGDASAVGAAIGLGVSTSPTRSGLVASSSVSTGGASNRTTPAVDTTGANLLLVHVTHTNAVSFSISDNYGNSWGFDTLQGNKTTSPDMASRIYRVTSQTPNVGPGHTITVNTGGGYPSIEFSAWRSGVPWTSGSIAVGKDALPHGAVAMTTVRAGDLILSFAGGNNTFVNVSQGTILDKVNNVGSQNWATAYAYLIASTGPNFTNSWSGTGEAVVINYSMRGIWSPEYGIGSTAGTSTASAVSPIISDPTAVGTASGASTVYAGSDPNTVYWKDSGTVWQKYNASLDAVNPSPVASVIRASLPHTTGLWYCEIEFLSGVGSSCGFGVADNTTAAGSGLDVYNPAKIGAVRPDTFTYLNGFTAPTNTGLGAVSVGTRIGLAVDCDHLELYLAKNGTFIGTSNPVTRTSPRIAWYGQAGINIFPVVSTLADVGVRIHASAATQLYAPPAGYIAWATVTSPTAVGIAAGIGVAAGVGSTGSDAYGVGLASALGSASATGLATTVNDTGVGTASAHSTATGVSPAAVSAVYLVTSYTPGTPRSDYSGYVGVTFRTDNTTEHRYNRMGIRAESGNSGSHTVGLYHYTGGDGTPIGTPFREVAIDLTGSTTGNFYYAEITEITLSALTSYLLVNTVTSGGQSWAGDGPVTVRGSTNVSAAYSPVGGPWSAPATAAASFVGVDLALIEGAAGTDANGVGTAVASGLGAAGASRGLSASGSVVALATVSGGARSDVSQPGSTAAVGTVTAGASRGLGASGSVAAFATVTAGGRSDVRQPGSTAAVGTVSADASRGLSASGSAAVLAAVSGDARSDVRQPGLATALGFAAGASSSELNVSGTGAAAALATVSVSGRSDASAQGAGSAATLVTGTSSTTFDPLGVGVGSVLSVAAATTSTGLNRAGATTGTSTANASGRSDAASQGLAAATGAVNGIAAVGFSQGLAAALGTVLATGRGDGVGQGAAPSFGVADAIGRADGPGSGASVGTAVAAGSSSAETNLVAAGAAAGLGTVSATGRGDAVFSGTSAAAGQVQAAQRVDIAVAGATVGTGLVTGASSAGLGVYGDGAAVATGTVAATGYGVGVAAGVGAAAGTVAGFGLGDGVAAGTAAAHGDASSIAEVGYTEGHTTAISTVFATGRGDGVAAGVGVAAGAVAGFVFGDGVAAGSAAAHGNANSIAEVGYTEGHTAAAANVQATGRSDSRPSGLAAALSTVAAIGQGDGTGTAASVSTSVVQSTGRSDANPIGSTTGLATVTAGTRTDVRPDGNAAASGLVNGSGRLDVRAGGAAFGLGFGRAVVLVVGSGLATSTVTAAGRSDVRSAGLTTGKAVGDAVGVLDFAAVAISVGLGHGQSFSVEPGEVIKTIELWGSLPTPISLVGEYDPAIALKGNMPTVTPLTGQRDTTVSLTGNRKTKINLTGNIGE